MNKKTNILLVNFDDKQEITSAVEHLTNSLEDSERFNITTINIYDNSAIKLNNINTNEFDCAVLLGQEEYRFSDNQLTALQQFTQSGGGLVVCHKALYSLAGNKALVDLLGVEPDGNESPAPFYYQINIDDSAAKNGHPLAVRSENFRVNDTFLPVKAKDNGAIFAATHLNHRPMPAGVSNIQGNTKAVYLAPGGSKDSLENRYFQRLIIRALRLTAGETKQTFTKTIKAGIIGYGGAFNMGRRHGQAINAQYGMETVAVCDLDTARLGQAKEELGDIATYQNSADLLNDSNINLVVVILPHNLHAKTCIEAAQARKHVVTEKPFTITLDEADNIINAAKEAGTTASCFHNRRWDGDFLKILELVQSGAIGDVYHIDAATANWAPARQWWRSDKSMSGGVLYDWGAHYTDWIFNLMPKRVASISGNIQKRFWHNATIEDFAQAHIRFEDGTTANLEQGTLAAIKRQGWRILGTKGAISNPAPGAEITLMQYDGASMNTSTIAPPQSNWVGFYKNIGNHIIMDEPLIVTPEQARRVSGVFEMAEKSDKKGGAVLKLPGEANFEPDYIFPL